MNDEKKRILDLIAEGKISSEEGAKLLKALHSDKPRLKKKGKKLHLLIKTDDSDKTILNLAIPVSLAKFGMKFIPANTKMNAKLKDTDFDFSDINWEEIIELATSGEEGELFHMEVNEEDSKPITIRIFIE